MSSRVSCLRLRLLGAFLLLAGAASGFAQTPTTFPRAYLGLGLGMASLTLPHSSGAIGATAVSTQSSDDHGLGWKGYAGYRIDPMWGLEVGYNYLGARQRDILTTASGTAQGRMNSSNFYTAVVANLDAGSGFSVLGKVGVARYYLAMDAVCVGAACSAPRGVSTYSWGLMAGVGLEYNWNRYGVRLEYEDYGKVSEDDLMGTGGSGALKANALTLSGKINF